MDDLTYVRLEPLIDSIYQFRVPINEEDIQEFIDKIKLLEPDLDEEEKKQLIRSNSIKVRDEYEEKLRKFFKIPLKTSFETLYRTTKEKLKEFSEEYEQIEIPEIENKYGITRILLYLKKGGKECVYDTIVFKDNNIILGNKTKGGCLEDVRILNRTIGKQFSTTKRFGKKNISGKIDLNPIYYKLILEFADIDQFRSFFELYNNNKLPGLNLEMSLRSPKSPSKKQKKRRKQTRKRTRKRSKKVSKRKRKQKRKRV